MKFPRKLPRPSLFDSVIVDREVTRKNVISRLLCDHGTTISYVHIDHRPGPGSYADTFRGVVCVDCGFIVEETKIL